jgi:hypothetical protein
MEYGYSKKAFSNKIEITNNEALLGFIIFSKWSSKAECQIGNNSYFFKKKGVFGADYALNNVDTGIVVAEIKFNFWGNNTVINLENNQQFNFRKNGLFSKSWELTSNTNEKLAVKNLSTFWNVNGIVYSEIKDKSTSDLMAVITIFIYFLKMKQAAAAAS